MPLRTTLLAGLLALPILSGRSPSPAETGRVAPGDVIGHRAMPHVAPETMGMSPERLARIDSVVRRGIVAGGFPGAAVVIGRRGAIVWERGFGTLDWGTRTAIDAEHTMFDVASITKVVATSAAVMVLVDRERLRLDDRVGRYLPEFARGAKARVTVRDLLTHRSGLPAGRDLSRAGGSVATARRLVLGAELESPPGTRGEYSDLGPEVLALLVEKVSGTPFDAFVRRNVFAPLGMQSTMFRPSPGHRSRIASTISTAARGEVHDANARALGGVAGHAGLFSTAGDLAVFAQMMLDGGTARGLRVVSDTTVALFTRRAAGWRALGWNTCSGGASCGRYLGPTAFGHTGFTGTSLWIDPEREMFVIVLTNWVHGRAGGGLAPVAVLHDVRGDVADLAALAVTDGGTVLSEPYRLRSELQVGWWR
jgi:serine-type D-Ala-D-Ala carboxypeptidase